MPLAFQSASHGTIAFGFFNIETDMLLLDQLFFFADRFCEAVLAVATAEGGAAEAPLAGWRIADRERVGDLHGAIAGTRLTGFIGETYRHHPFPREPEGFRQSPDGAQRQAEVEGMIEPFGEVEAWTLGWDRATSALSIAEYRFSEPMFAALVAYVDRGGYPRWREEQRPPYVSAMVQRLTAAGSPLWPADDAPGGA